MASGAAGSAGAQKAADSKTAADNTTAPGGSGANTAVAPAVASPTPNRQTVFTYTMGTTGEPIRIAEVWGVNEVGTKLWDTQLLLARHFETHSPPVSTFGVGGGDGRRSRWLELGAGCGLLALILQRLGCDVVATEIPEILPLLNTNIAANPLTLAAAPSAAAAAAAATTTSAAAAVLPPATIRAAKLFWGLSDDIATFTRAGGGAPFDGIVASDVTYIDELVVPLLETIHALSAPATYIAVAGRIRSESAHLMFVTHAQALGFDVDISALNASPASAAAATAGAIAAPSGTAAAASASSVATAGAAGATATASALPVESADDHFDTASTFDFLCRLRKRK